MELFNSQHQAVSWYSVGMMSDKQNRHYDRKWLKLLKRELECYRKCRAMGIRLLWYPDPARLPA